VKKFALAMWKEDQGFLTFEWILLVTLLTIGIVSGITAVRDATIDELGDVAQAMLSLDQSYTIAGPLAVVVHDPTNSGGSDSSFRDQIILFDHCGRFAFNSGASTDCDKTNTPN
jgi:Flp pilus assembly pilin Flp